MFKKLSKSFKNFVGLLKDTGGDKDLKSLEDMKHRVIFINEFGRKLKIASVQLNDNPSYGAVMHHHGRRIEVVYPMYDDFKVFFEKYILFYNLSNPIVCVISTSGEKIAEGIWGLSFKKNSLSLYNPEVNMEITLNADGSRSSDTRDLDAIIKKVNKSLKNIKISTVPHNPEWIVSDRRTYFDAIPEEYHTEFYFTSSEPLVVDNVNELSNVVGSFVSVQVNSEPDTEDEDEKERLKTLDEILYCT